MLNVLKKVKEKGLKKSVRMISVKMKKKGILKTPALTKSRRQAVDQIINKKYKRVIIFENHFGYYNIMLQRPQHITRQLSDEDTLVLYNSYYDIDFKDKDRITKLKENYYIIDMFYYREILKETWAGTDIDKYLMIYSTDTVSLDMIKEYEQLDYKIIYEYVDDIDPDLIFKQNLENILNRHEYLISNNENYIVTTATKLYNNARQINENANVKLICNGVECDVFSPDRKTKDPEYRRWMKEGTIKVGYYGAMASWVDYDLLKKLAEDKNIQLILIGVMHDDSLKESGLTEYENVKYFGKVPYRKLAGYANYFDVCIIPFKLNSITESTSPVKLFEYMSLEKPVVTTALPECKKYPVVYIADTEEEFCKKVHLAYERKDEKAFKKELKDCAVENSWEMKAKNLKEFLEEQK